MGVGCGQPAGSARPARASPHCFPLYLPLPPRRSPELDWMVAGDGCCPLSSRECSWLKPPYCSAGPEQFRPPGARATSKANLILPPPCSINTLPWLPAALRSIFAPPACAHLVPLPGVPLLPCLSEWNPTHSLRSFLLGSPRCPWLGQSDSHSTPPPAGPPWHPYFCLMPSPQGVLPCG